jgi:hypothetical protein
MATRKFNSRALRELAQEVIQEIADDLEIPEADREDLVTSLVRQWITYDRNATFFFGDQQVYLVLAATPLGKPCIVPETAQPRWFDRLQEDWKIDPAELPAILAELNLAQSAETTSTDGIPLRLWVNPKDRSRGVEPLVKQPVHPGKEINYHKIATSELEKHLGYLDNEELDALACSVAKQWHQYQGHASLFLDRGQQLILVLRDQEGGGCQVSATKARVGIEPLFRSLGFADDIIPDVVARLNLGQAVQFQSREGVDSLLWHDPRERRIRTRPSAASMVRPFVCPRCTAVLRPWKDNEQEQTCPHCGHTISLS